MITTFKLADTKVFDPFWDSEQVIYVRVTFVTGLESYFDPQNFISKILSRARTHFDPIFKSSKAFFDTVHIL